MRSFSVLCAMALAAVANALPDVRAERLGVECKHFPGFNGDTGEAGPWPLYADSTDQPIAQGAGSTIGAVDPSAHALYQIGIATDPTLAKIVVKCGPNAEGRSGLQALVSRGWQPVTQGPGNENAFLLVGQEEGGRRAELQAHAHFYANGTQQEGVFLGWQRVTTWAYKRVRSAGIEQYRLRLLLVPESLEAGESLGFVRVGL